MHFVAHSPYARRAYLKKCDNPPGLFSVHHIFIACRNVLAIVLLLRIAIAYQGEK